MNVRCYLFWMFCSEPIKSVALLLRFSKHGDHSSGSAVCDVLIGWICSSDWQPGSRPLFIQQCHYLQKKAQLQIFKASLNKNASANVSVKCFTLFKSLEHYQGALFGLSRTFADWLNEDLIWEPERPKTRRYFNRLIAARTRCHNSR